MTGLLEELADGNVERIRDRRESRGPGVDILALGAGNGLAKQPAPVRDLGEAQAPAPSDALDALHWR
jgi:hypothetical protein